MSKLGKRISFNISGKDKKGLQVKAETMGIPLAQLIRNIVLDKYKPLVVGYSTPNLSIPQSISHDIDIRKLKPPKTPMKMTKEQISMKDCINELKGVFENGFNVLVKMDSMTDQEREEYNKNIIGVKTKDDLEESSKKSEEIIYDRLSKEIKQSIQEKNLEN